MRKLFFHGGRSATYAATAPALVRAAGGPSARIAFLSSGGPSWDRYLDWYSQPLLEAGAAEVIPIVPQGDDLQLTDRALADLERATGFYMGGGDTRAYHQAYATGPAREILRRRYRESFPYGGLSAGALIASAECSIWGDRLTTETNRLQLRGSEDGCDAELLTGRGLGLIGGLLCEAHFSKLGGFPRLIAVLQQTGVPLGLGIDDEIGLEITDEREVQVHGVGRAYAVESAGSGFNVRVYEPGDRFLLT